MPPQTDSWRRLIRLGVALLLVVVLMGQAKRPEHYAPFFGKPAEGWQSVTDGTAMLPAGGSPSPAETLVAAAGQDPAATEDTWAGATPWVESMDLPIQRTWCAILIRWRDGSLEDPSAESDSGDSQSARDSSDRESAFSHAGEWLASDSGTQATEISEAINRLADGKPDSWADARWWASPTLDALRQAAFQRVSDGTFWTGSDSDAFYMQLVDETAAESATETGTVPLLQQPDVYRGQAIRVTGQLGMAERREAKNNAFGIESYWSLWVIPGDGGIRPINLIVHNMPAALEDHLADDGTWDAGSDPTNPDGELSAVGRFLKRLPYRSSIGADLAPVVVGNVVATKGLPAGVARSVEPTSSRSDSERRWHLIGLIAAVLAGVMIAVTLMSRSAKADQRVRQLRQEETGDATEAMQWLTDERADENQNS